MDRAPLLSNVLGFDLLRRIGGSGANRVYEASCFGERLALKIVDLSDENVRRRFARESKIGSLFQHQSVVPTLAASSSGHLGWIAMPLFEGAPLGERSRDPDFAFEQRYTVVREIAEGLAHIHVHGAIHGDLQPSNVLVTRDGAAKILDFGSALFDWEARSPEERSYQANAYVSPERIREEPFDHRSDLFSLGVITFELMTGTIPWHAKSLVRLLLAMCSEAPISFRDAALASPISIPKSAIGPMADVIERALSDQPSSRFASASTFVDAWMSAVH